MAGAFPTRSTIAAQQLSLLRKLLDRVSASNPFYRVKLGEISPGDIRNLGEYSARVPLTTKAELVRDQENSPPFGTNLTFPPEAYTRFHQTSGTSGSPLRWLDTPESWEWMVQTWLEIFRAAGVGRSDRILFAFSFGPFIGFWLAFEAGQKAGALCLPAGGLRSSARLKMLMENQATVLCCTPTYALRLAEVAAEEKIDLQRGAVKTIIVAGEAGGSIPATRRRLEEVWPGARIFDHHGMTEVGPVTHECPLRPGFLHVIESACLAEIVDPASGQGQPVGETGELVLTTLGRTGSPLLRYRTGDLVKLVVVDPCACGRHGLGLEGGILGRSDDMVVIRGVNVYPSAIEGILHRFPAVAQFQATVTRSGSLAELAVSIEPRAGVADGAGLCEMIARELQAELNLRVPVSLAGLEGLPRFEMKARRWIMP